ncbi:MAG: TRAP transporter small permease [Pseudomonadota bacterium]
MVGALARGLDRVGTALKLVAAALLISIGVLIAVDVIMRSVVNRPIIGVAEIVANGVVIIAYLQLVYTVRIGAMLRSELLLNLLGRRGKIALESFVSMLGALFFGLIAWTSYPAMVNAFVRNEFEGHASFQIPVWPVRAVIVVCSILAVLTYLTVAWRAIARGELPDDAEAPSGAGTQ